MARFADAAAIIQRGIDERAYPAAVIEVGTRGGPLWQQAFGRLTYEVDSQVTRKDTIFDLASLTKVIATTSLVMRLIEQRKLSLSDRVGHWIPEWRGQDRKTVTIESLLTHSSGLTAWLPLYRDYSGRTEFQHAICSLPLESRPGTKSIYSDLGFILLGFIIQDAGIGTLETQTDQLLATVTSAPLVFNPAAALRPLVAPTEHDRWRGRLLVGEVDDENCWALGGASGHAGLFGTAQAVGDFARAVLDALAGEHTPLADAATLRRFITRADVPESSRALGWDTMLPTSSCGARMSPSAFGHTGFTGTTLWIDPERAVYVAFLTNRVHPTRVNTAIQQIRPAVHDAVMAAVG